MSEEKKVISRVLQEKRQWFDVSHSLPKEGLEVVVRICNENMNFGETPDGNVFAAEDEKIAFYAKGQWMIAPPYPKFDYSPLSNGPFLKEGSVITHWAIPEDATEGDIGELDAWKTRFDISGKYNKLVIQIDKEHEELLYRACSWGAASIRQIAGEDEDSLAIIGLLWDIQSLMDQDAEIHDGKIVKLGGDLSEALNKINAAKEALKEEDE